MVASVEDFVIKFCTPLCNNHFQKTRPNGVKESQHYCKGPSGTHMDPISWTTCRYNHEDSPEVRTQTGTTSYKQR